MNPNVWLRNPKTGGDIFGYVSDLKGPRGFEQAGGPIVLKHGRHNGPNRGFGAVHIWAEHEAEMRRRDHASFNDVPAFVMEIISPGAPVHCEFRIIAGDQWVTVLRSTKGTEVLRPFSNHYSVVTAFSGYAKHGPRVGTVLGV